MKDIADYAKALAKQYGGDILGKKEEPKPEPPPAPRRTEYTASQVARPAAGAPRIWPSEMMELRSWKSDHNKRPTRAPVNIFEFTDGEIEEMFATPVRRGWEFSDWLEVIGLPPDLHKEHDGVTYSYAARAFLERKKEAHQR